MNPTRLFGPLIFLGFAFAIGLDSASAQPDDLVQTVQQAWKGQQDRLQRVAVKWQEEHLNPRGSATDITARTGKEGEILPPGDRTHREEHYLAMDGRKFLLDSRRMLFNSTVLDYASVRISLVYDGDVLLRYRDQSHMPKELNVGTRQVTSRPEGLTEMTLAPMVQNLRPVDAEHARIFLERYQASGRFEMVLGRRCVELKARSLKSGSGTNSLWVDPERGYVLVRRQVEPSARSSPILAFREDISYREIQPGLWVPSGWTLVIAGRSVPVRSRIVATVTQFDVGPSSRLTFDTSSPRSSIIDEMVSDAPTKTFVTLADGRQKEVKADEMSSAATEVLISQYSAASTSWFHRNRLISWGVLSCLLGLWGLAYYQRRSRLAKKALCFEA